MITPPSYSAQHQRQFSSDTTPSQHRNAYTTISRLSKAIENPATLSSLSETDRLDILSLVRLISDAIRTTSMSPESNIVSIHSPLCGEITVTELETLKRNHENQAVTNLQFSIDSNAASTTPLIAYQCKFETILRMESTLNPSCADPQPVATSPAPPRLPEHPLLPGASIAVQVRVRPNTEVLSVPVSGTFSFQRVHYNYSDHLLKYLRKGNWEIVPASDLLALCPSSLDNALQAKKWSPELRRGLYADICEYIQTDYMQHGDTVISQDWLSKMVDRFPSQRNLDDLSQVRALKNLIAIFCGRGSFSRLALGRWTLEDKMTPIMLAAKYSNAELVAYLVDFFSIESIDNNGYTAEVYAAINGNVDILGKLFAYRARKEIELPLNAKYGKEKLTLLQFAEQNNHAAAVVFLKEKMNAQSLVRPGGAEAVQNEVSIAGPQSGPCLTAKPIKIKESIQRPGPASISNGIDPTVNTGKIDMPEGLGLLMQTIEKLDKTPNETSERGS